jgi:hypothetical protein
VRALLVTILAVVGSLAAGVAGATAADECRGLQVCLPLDGPWVVIPAGSAATAPVAQYDLRCPARGYIVAGTDVRISDRQIDVGIRGETGSPVGPGTTTQEAVLFTGFYAGGAGRRTAFKPFIGCIPTSGGGARSQTARGAVGEGLKPTRPVVRVVTNRKLSVGPTRVAARCAGGSRLVGGAHAVGFRSPSPPSDTATEAVTTKTRVAGNTVTVTAVVGAAAIGGKPELQVQAFCTRTAP